MTFEEIQEEWGKDSKIDLGNLNYHSAETHSLMSKYMNLRAREKITLAALEMNGVKLRHQRKQYYLGELPLEKLRELKWLPFPKKIIKLEVNEYLDADEQIIDHNMKIAISKNKVSFLEDVVNALSFRSNTIRNIIANNRFMAGLGKESEL